MENAFKSIIGGGDDTKKAQARDFVSRVTTGDPLEGFSDDEVRESAAVLRDLSPEQRQRAMSASVQNMNVNMKESDRSALQEMIQQRQRGEGMVDITRSGENVQPGSAAAKEGGGGGLEDLLGGLLGGGASQSGGGGGLGDLLGGLLGGGGQQSGGGGGIGDLLGGLLGGDDKRSGDVEQQQSGDAGSVGASLGDFMSSSMGKAVIAGAAAYAMKEILD